MKKLIVLLVLLSLLCSSALCAQHVVYENVIDSSAKRDITVNFYAKGNTVLENPLIPGENPINGTPYDGDYIPILVSISNVASARPQWGVDKADLIYEVPINGHRLTRLFALFMSEHPTQVGPVRSARSFHATIREEWDASIMYAGSRPDEDCTNEEKMQLTFKNFGVTTTKKGLRLNYDLNGSSTGAYNTERVNYHYRPNNLSVDLSKFIDTLSQYNFVPRPYQFTDDLPSAGVEATKISVDFNDDNTDTYYLYHEDDNRYYRFCDNKPYVDYLNPDTQLGFANVIIQRVDLSFYYSASDRPCVPLTGEGNADIFTGGRYIAGKWIRKTTSDRTVFVDEEGNELKFQRGTSWISITSNVPKVSYE